MAKKRRFFSTKAFTSAYNDIINSKDMTTKKYVNRSISLSVVKLNNVLIIRSIKTYDFSSRPTFFFLKNNNFALERSVGQKSSKGF